jgi:hypothetical protein
MARSRLPDQAELFCCTVEVGMKARSRFFVFHTRRTRAGVCSSAPVRLATAMIGSVKRGRLSTLISAFAIENLRTC